MPRLILCLVLLSTLLTAAPTTSAAKSGPTSLKRSAGKVVTVLPKNGQTTFVFGNTVPTIVCAPLHVCDLRLETGETITQVNGGDTLRWKISSGMSGTGGKSQGHILIKPTEPNLASNLVITTDRRTYSVNLVSRQNDWMPIIAFRYPPQNDDPTNPSAIVPATSLRGSRETPARLDFGYKISGPRVSWRPLRVYTDGVKTYLQFSSHLQQGEAPVLVALDAREQPLLVNYRVQQNVFVADKVLDRAALLQGVGRSQKKVLIHRVRGKS